MDKVFVYGTLLRGKLNHYFMREIVQGRFIEKMVSPRIFNMKSFCRLPMVTPGEFRVRGELYEVDSDGLMYLDELEYNGSLYTRNMIEDYWVYMMSPSMSAYVGSALSDDYVVLDKKNRTKYWGGA